MCAVSSSSLGDETVPDTRQFDQMFTMAFAAVRSQRVAGPVRPATRRVSFFLTRQIAPLRDLPAQPLQDLAAFS